jgi:hypothetical protein
MPTKIVTMRMVDMTERVPEKSGWYTVSVSDIISRQKFCLGRKVSEWPYMCPDGFITPQYWAESITVTEEKG